MAFLTSTWFDFEGPNVEQESVGGQSPLVRRGQSPAVLSAFDPLEAEERLRLASGKIRFEIAGYLHRKRVPELKFRVIPPPADRQ